MQAVRCSDSVPMQPEREIRQNSEVSIGQHVEYLGLDYAWNEDWEAMS